MFLVNCESWLLNAAVNNKLSRKFFRKINPDAPKRKENRIPVFKGKKKTFIEMLLALLLCVHCSTLVGCAWCYNVSQVQQFCI